MVSLLFLLLVSLYIEPSDASDTPYDQLPPKASISFDADDSVEGRVANRTSIPRENIVCANEYRRTLICAHRSDNKYLLSSFCDDGRHGHQPVEGMGEFSTRPLGLLVGPDLNKSCISRYCIKDPVVIVLMASQIYRFRKNRFFYNWIWAYEELESIDLSWAHECSTNNTLSRITLSSKDGNRVEMYDQNWQLQHQRGFGPDDIEMDHCFTLDTETKEESEQ